MDLHKEINRRQSQMSSRRLRIRRGSRRLLYQVHDDHCSKATLKFAHPGLATSTAGRSNASTLLKKKELDKIRKISWYSNRSKTAVVTQTEVEARTASTLSGNARSGKKRKSVRNSQEAF